MSDFGESIPIISTINDRRNSTDKLSTEVKLVEYLPAGTLTNAYTLNEGYSEQLDEWKLIIKFTGSLRELSGRYGINAEDLGYGYALIDVNRSILPQLEADENVLYVDKPQRLYIDRYGRAL